MSRSRTDRRDQEEQRGGDAHQGAGQPAARQKHALARHRSHDIRWTALVYRRARAGTPHRGFGWLDCGASQRDFRTRYSLAAIRVHGVARAAGLRRHFRGPGQPEIRGQFFGAGTWRRAPSSPGLRISRFLDKTGSLANPFHNFADLRYDAVSELPRDSAPRFCVTLHGIYPESLRACLPAIAPSSDPRISATGESRDRRSRQRHRLTTKRARSRATCAIITATRWTFPARLRWIPGLFRFSEKRAGHCRNILPRP